MDIHRILKRLILALCFMFVSISALGTWSVKNEKAGTGTGNPQNTAAFANALTNSSLIVVYVDIATSAVVGVPTDTAGNTYADCGPGAIHLTGLGYYIQCFYALNTHTTASNVIHIPNAVGRWLAVCAVELTGGAAASILDVNASNADASTGTGGGQNMTSTTATTTVDGDLIIGCGLPASGTLTAGTGFTTIDTGTIGPNFEYEAQATHASVAATWNLGTNNISYSALMATFKPAIVCDAPNSACYVRAGASGSNDGSDWTNAYTVLPATLTRGYTYYIASGTYAEYYANTANSGTTIITIQAATTASHGTGTGWSSAYATDVSGPAIFNASTGGTGISINNNSSYWNIDGHGTYTGMGCGPGGAGCGFKIDGSHATSAYNYSLGLCLAAYHGWTSCPHDISVSYMEIQGAGFANADISVDSNIHMDSDGWTSSNGGGSNFTLSHIYLHGSSGGPIFTEFVTGITLDHSYITGNVSTSTHHGEAWADMGSSNVTISNDNFEDPEGSGAIVELDRGGCTASCVANNWLMYGDIFYYDNGNTRSCTTAPCNTGIGDGVIDCINGMICTGWVIEQDTFANLYGINAALCEDCTAEGNVASTWTVRNNLWYGNTNGGIEMGSEEHKCAACTVTEDYNSILGYNTGTLDTGFFSGAHDVILVATPSSPFVAWTATPPNFHLIGENAYWNNGLTLGSPYNVDPDGVARGLDGQWDRGVFEFFTAPLYPVINLRAIPH